MLDWEKSIAFWPRSKPEKLPTEKVTLPETNSSHLEVVVSNRNLLFQGSILRGYVSVRMFFVLVWNLVLFFHLDELGLMSFCMVFCWDVRFVFGSKSYLRNLSLDHRTFAGHNDRFLKRHLSKALRNGGFWFLCFFSCFFFILFHCTQLGIKKTLRKVTMAPIFSSFGMKRLKRSFVMPFLNISFLKDRKI